MTLLPVVISPAAKEAALSAEAWQAVKRQVASRAKLEGSVVHPTTLVAVETEGGFEIAANLVRKEITSLSELIDTDGNSLGSCTIALDENGFYQIDVPEIDVRQQATIIALEASDGNSLIAIAHHTFNVVVSAQTERQRELRHAISNLDAAAPMLEDMLRIVERVIFDDFDNLHMAESGQRPLRPCARVWAKCLVGLGDYLNACKSFNFDFGCIFSKLMGLY